VPPAAAWRAVSADVIVDAVKCKDGLSVSVGAAGPDAIMPRVRSASGSSLQSVDDDAFAAAYFVMPGTGGSSSSNAVEGSVMDVVLAAGSGYAQHVAPPLSTCLLPGVMPQMAGVVEGEDQSTPAPADW